ncbi:uncharacterized protein C8A04DRAFT_8913 [Dichotomopilus funicola]|uniref:Uncharacterized protein n=1 Tax=Dichotomopilus funicola TaxID=1934379 RepID=A0AAN6ZSL8_9PEZI|nr:hypothetical protein C8A04DRAFT_8913 [Dichotomopilus funicola]
MVDISLAVSAGHTPQAQPTPTAEELGFDPRVRNPRAWFNGRQLSYLLLSQAIPSMVIAGGLNAAFAYPVYSSPRPPPGPPPEGSIPPFLFSPPLSLIVDATFTTFIQSVITWLILAYLVNRSISRGEVQPHNPTLFREPTSAFWRWFFMLDHYNSTRGSACFSRRVWFGRQGTRLCQAGNLCAAASPASSGDSSPAPARTRSLNMQRLSAGLGRVGAAVSFFLAGVGRGLLMGFPAIVLMIGPTVGLSMLAGERYNGDWIYLGRWAGMIFKALYGGVLGFWLSPFIAWMWMVRAGWIVSRHILVV